jgi:hypothetical protein
MLKAANGVRPDQPSLGMNGEVEILTTGDLGEIHISAPFEKCRRRDREPFGRERPLQGERRVEFALEPCIPLRVTAVPN